MLLSAGFDAGRLWLEDASKRLGVAPVKWCQSRLELLPCFWVPVQRVGVMEQSLDG